MNEILLPIFWKHKEMLQIKLNDLASNKILFDNFQSVLKH